MISLYKKILFATDLGPQSLYVGHRALQLAALHGAECIVLHVIEPPMTYTAEFSEREKLIEQTKAAAQKSLASFCVALNQPSLSQLVSLGTPNTEIIEIAYKQQCDLIILGSHGVGGYTHLLGSTAHTIISEAYCDALVVQVSHLQKSLEKIIPQQGQYLWQLPTVGDKPDFNILTGPKISGSEKGFGEVVKRGPRFTNRPSRFPYKGGTRERDPEDDDPANS